MTMNLSDVKFSKITHVLERAHVGDVLVVPADEKWLITFVQVKPTSPWVPPTAEDRWGQREDVIGSLGDLVILVDDQEQWRASIVVLMDAWHRLSTLEGAVEFEKVNRALTFVASHAGQDIESARALEGAIEGAKLAWSSFVMTLVQDGVLKIPVAASGGQRISFVQQGNKQVDNRDIAVEFTSFVTVPLSEVFP